MFKIFYPTKDTTISNVTIRGLAKSSSNSGRSEIVELYALTESLQSRGVSRILMQFDIASLSASTASGEIPTASVQYTLKLTHAESYETLPSSFDIVCYPLSRSWDEGRGLQMYDEGLKDDGYANWHHAQSTVAWSITGSDFITSVSASQHFDSGEENLELDISPIVYAWLTGGVANHGVVIKLTDAHEASVSDVYVKKFFSRHAHVQQRSPIVKALWQDVVRDERSSVAYGVSSSIVYYRSVNGAFQDAGPMFVNILNSSSTVVQTLTASQVKTGIYQVSGVAINFTSSTSTFRDVWFSSSTQYFTGTIRPVFQTGSQFFDFRNLDVKIPNIKYDYSNDERVIFRVFAHQKDYDPGLVLSASVTPRPVILRNAYFSLTNDSTDEVFIQHSTGSLKYSQLSYDEGGNWFELFTNSLQPEVVYKIKILSIWNNQRVEFDNGWTITVRR